MKTWISSIFLAVAFVGFGQGVGLLKDSIVINDPNPITDFSVDARGQIYFVTQNNRLTAVNPHSNTPAKHFTHWLDIQELNTQNPFFITFTNSLYELHFLDPNLNETRDPVNLFSNINFTPALVALVDNLWLWGYDNIRQRMVLWNFQEQKTLAESQQLSPQENETFLEVLHHEQATYLITNQRLLKLDRLARITETLPFEGGTDFRLHKNHLLYTQDKSLYSLDLSQKNAPMPFPLEKPIDFFSVMGDTLFVVSGKVVYLYPLNF